MPGTPDPVLGSRLATVCVAGVAGALVAVAPYALSRALPESGPRPAALAAGGGLVYAVLCIGTWAGVRVAADAFVRGLVADPVALSGLTLVGLVVFGAHAAIPYYFYARWRLVAPLAALFAVTALVLFVFLRVGGESDPMGLYVIGFAPLVIAGLLALGLAEFGVRRYVVGAV